ncbi:hypothetical protein BDF20DRAFT_880346 [Mycotypha africana]|uniref:uncharacterized protein n=1 Tax=Mycotypha africana TaxID=64632 RepID=UPI0023004587|nr:uncharacterized protein BDF20DRAFT_880346 [Mycotypha africana]KAI8975725.1 hypothetical protein BDF20DRAFT_880346 [Mycotypha africana]
MTANDNAELKEQDIFSAQEQYQLQRFLNDFETAVDTDIASPKNFISNQERPESSATISGQTSDNSNSTNKRKRSTPLHKQKSGANISDSATTTAGKPVVIRTGRARKAPHELLTEEQKKANHIASEQKRRANIRVGFDQLVEVVPTLDNGHRSESVILQKSVNYIRDLLEDKNKLKERVRELQISLGEV